MRAAAKIPAASRRGATLGLALAGLAAWLLAGCTTVEVVGAKPTKRLWAFGVVKLAPDPAASPVMLIASRGFGIVPGADGVTLGYRKDLQAFISDPDKCRVIFFSSPSDAVRDPMTLALAAALKEEELCVVTSGKRPPSRP